MLVSFTFNRTEEDKQNNPEVKPIFSKKNNKSNDNTSIYYKQYYILNYERINLMRKRYYKAHREQELIYSKQYQIQNKEKIIKWREENQDKIKGYYQKYKLLKEQLKNT